MLASSEHRFRFLEPISHNVILIKRYMKLVLKHPMKRLIQKNCGRYLTGIQFQCWKCFCIAFPGQLLVCFWKFWYHTNSTFPKWRSTIWPQFVLQNSYLHRRKLFKMTNLIRKMENIYIFWQHALNIMNVSYVTD